MFLTRSILLHVGASEGSIAHRHSKYMYTAVADLLCAMSSWSLPRALLHVDVQTELIDPPSFEIVDFGNIVFNCETLIWKHSALRFNDIDIGCSPSVTTVVSHTPAVPQPVCTSGLTGVATPAVGRRESVVSSTRRARP